MKLRSTSTIAVIQEAIRALQRSLDDSSHLMINLNIMKKKSKWSQTTSESTQRLIAGTRDHHPKTALPLAEHYLGRFLSALTHCCTARAPQSLSVYSTVVILVILSKLSSAKRNNHPDHCALTSDSDCVWPKLAAVLSIPTNIYKDIRGEKRIIKFLMICLWFWFSVAESK